MTGADARRTAGPGGRTAPVGVWWLAPALAVLLVAVPTLLLAWATPDTQYRIAWRTPKALTTETVLLVLCGALTMAVAAALPLLERRPGPRRWPDLSPAQTRVLSAAAGPLFWLTMTGYLAFAVSGVRNGLRPVAVVQALVGQDVFGGDLKDAFGGIPGVTTLTQVGMAFVVVAALLLVQAPDRRLRRRLVVVLVLGLLRSSLVAERLATLELLIPVAAVLALHWSASASRLKRRAVALLPVAMVPLLLVVFGVFEYSRSWTWYSTRTDAPYAQFVVERLAGYYATAYNNGHLGLEHETYPGRVPFDSVEAVWTSPTAPLYGGYPGPDPQREHAVVLQQHANPEFNSPGGLVVPFIDWGPVGGLVLLGGTGLLLGLAYRDCVQGGPVGTVVYPALATGLFELPRYLYWPLGRFAPSLAVLLLLAYLLHRAGRAGAAADPPADADAGRAPEPGGTPARGAATPAGPAAGDRATRERVTGGPATAEPSAHDRVLTP